MGRSSKMDPERGEIVDAPDETWDKIQALIGSPPRLGEVFGLTDVGCVRKHNEDQFLIAELERAMTIRQSSRPPRDGTRLSGHRQARLMMVADGMGGHAAGEVASAFTVDEMAHYAFTIMPWVLPASRLQPELLARGLRDAVRGAEERMLAFARSKGLSEKMGTTLTIAYVSWPQLYVVHVGDSRCYAMRDGRIYQITHDHTLAQRLVDSSTLTPEEAEESHFANILVNSLGGSTQADVELHQAELEVGDVILLCSDGLTKHVHKDNLARILGRIYGGASVEECARLLVASAKNAGGTDNITVVLARF